jgi:excisionase family DNA binding protein
MPQAMPEYLTVADVASALAVSEQTVLRWIDVGTLRAVRLPTGRGGHPSIRIDRRDVAALPRPIAPSGVAR